MEHNTYAPLIQADSQNIQAESLDCGIIALKWCTGAKCQKMAKTRNYVVVFSIICFLEGAILTYFDISAQQAGVELGFDPTVMDWLLASLGIARGFFAFGLVFYSRRFNPMAWISGFVLLEAAFCVIAIIPTLTVLGEGNQETLNRTIYSPPLCDSMQSSIEKVNPHHSTVTLILLFVLHAVISIASGVTYCIGYAYLDDNSKKRDFAILAGIALASRFTGSQLGSAISIVVETSTLGWWLGWVIFVPFLIVFGILIGLFPRKLTKTVVRQAADLIVMRISQANLIQDVPIVREFSFLPTVKRLCTNKILMFNLLAFTFFETALVNFAHQEENYIQSRFNVPTSVANGLLDEWKSRFLLILLKPPIIGLTTLFTGFIISKLMPTARKLAIWNLIVEILCGIIFISFIFLYCKSEKLASTHNGKITQPYCSSNCLCGNDIPFTPVCPAQSQHTYFSPCHAGCKFTEKINGVLIYKDCSCGENPEIPILNGMATAEACNNEECHFYWLIYQYLTLLAGFLLTTCEIGRLLIYFRSVLPQDKILTLAMECTISGIIVFLPGKLAYDFIADSTCLYRSSDLKHCYLQESPKYGDNVNIFSAILFFISAIFDFLVFICAKNLDCFNTRTFVNDKNAMVPLQTMVSRVDTVGESQNEREIQRPVVINSGNLLTDSSPDSSVFQNSPRRIGGRLQIPSLTSNSEATDSVIYADVQHRERPNDQLVEPKRITPQSQNLEYAQVMFELKKKSKIPSSSPKSDQESIIVNSDLEENLDFRLRTEQSPNRNDADADDERSEFGTSSKNGKLKGKETSF